MQNLPIGPIVDPQPAPRPRHVELEGRTVRVVPLDAQAHARALYEGSSGEASESLWAYMFNGPFADFASFEGDVQAKSQAADPLYFAVVDKASGAAVGYQSLMRIDPTHRVIEVGGIMYTPALQGTIGSTEAQYLFARHVFEDLGYRRYEWKCNDLNAPSKRAALRLGFAFEGVFRQHMIIKGRNRDTAWFSMLDHEWPARRAAFERWLDPDNFDGRGRQKSKLGDIGDAGVK